MTASVLHRILTHPYYVGVVVYGGSYYEGKHPALIPRETWLRVQDVLGAHNTAGEKDMRHLHHLRRAIFCGECGNRMIFSLNRNRHGNTFDYFFCIGRRAMAATCSRGYIRVETIEAG